MAVSWLATTTPSRTRLITESFAVTVASTPTTTVSTLSPAATTQGPLSGAQAASVVGTVPPNVSAVEWDWCTRSFRSSTAPVAAST